MYFSSYILGVLYGEVRWAATAYNCTQSSHGAEAAFLFFVLLEKKLTLRGLTQNMLFTKSYSFQKISKLITFIIEKQPEDDSSQAFISTQNGSPCLNRAEVPTRPASQEAYDVVLQRKETEGFGFVILTSKSKPPPGGEGHCFLLSLPVRPCV